VLVEAFRTSYRGRESVLYNGVHKSERANRGHESASRGCESASRGCVSVLY
jgi:hypothetical protein